MLGCDRGVSTLLEILGEKIEIKPTIRPKAFVVSTLLEILVDIYRLEDICIEALPFQLFLRF